MDQNLHANLSIPIPWCWWWGRVRERREREVLEFWTGGGRRRARGFVKMSGPVQSIVDPSKTHCIAVAVGVGHLNPPRPVLIRWCRIQMCLSCPNSNDATDDRSSIQTRSLCCRSCVQIGQLWLQCPFALIKKSSCLYTSTIEPSEKLVSNYFKFFDWKMFKYRFILNYIKVRVSLSLTVLSKKCIVFHCVDTY